MLAVTFAEQDDSSSSTNDEAANARVTAEICLADDPGRRSRRMCKQRRQGSGFR
jgi:hypothetical protein